jgi:hypothetical protein
MAAIYTRTEISESKNVFHIWNILKFRGRNNLRNTILMHTDWQFYFILYINAFMLVCVPQKLISQPSIENISWEVHFHFIIQQLTYNAQRLLYVPPGLTFTNSTFCPHSVFMCFVWISEQTAIIPL